MKNEGSGAENNDESLVVPPKRRRRRRRAPFASSRIAAAATTTRTTALTSSNRPQRLFSARAFSASKSRSPFADDSYLEEQQPGTSSGSQQQPSGHHIHQAISSQTTVRPLAQRLSINRNSHLAPTVEETFEEPSTGDDLSDIDDIDLGDLYTDGWELEAAAEQQSPSRTAQEGQSRDIAAKRKGDGGGGRGNMRFLTQQSSLDDSHLRARFDQQLERRRRRMEPPFRHPPTSAGLESLSDLEAGELRPPAESEAARAFSPALDMELAPASAERKESRASTPRIPSQIWTRPKTPSPSNDERGANTKDNKSQEWRKKSSTQNGSIGGVLGPLAVPTPPEITVSSPREQPQQQWRRIAAEETCSSASSAIHPTTMNPSLIKGLSKSISRFRGRNRIMDADAVEQANFMSKFGMSGTGVQQTVVGPAAAGRGRLRGLVFDANENYFYHWIALISTAYVYNLLVVVARTVFVDLAAGRLWMLWLCLDLLMDSIFLADMFVRSRTGYLEQGLLVRDCAKIRAAYLRSRQFLWDCVSVLPLDHFCLLLWRQQPILRINRLLRKDRIQRFMEQTETRTSMPNAFRVGVVVWYIAVIIHWNACFYFLISESIGLGSDPWVYGALNKQSLPDGINDTLTRRYIYSFYWSTLILTTIGEVPGPQQNIEYAFVTIDLMCGVLIFATIVGNVGSMISNTSAGRTNFQNRIDSIKQYMNLRGVGKQLEVRVIKWFDYLWANKQGLTDAQVLKVLPDKLQAEIAMHVHFETLRKVRIFQDCEAGLLAELVLKLQLQVFSPGDYVCRKGDIGREMYIVKRGMLQVVADDGIKVFATLSEGAVFGELSILNIAGSKNGNRRTANVRSVGYTDLFVLNKSDLWIALREYPEARKVLINKGRELLRKDNLLDENAPEEHKSAEELSEELQSAVRILQIRIARLIAEHTNTDTKLRERVTYLEGKLRKYGALPADNKMTEADEDQEEEKEMEAEMD